MLLLLVPLVVVVVVRLEIDGGESGRRAEERARKECPYPRVSVCARASVCVRVRPRAYTPKLWAAGRRCGGEEDS